jgi:hypothetical protein
MPVRTPATPGVTLTRSDDSQDNRLAEPRQPNFVAELRKTQFATLAWHHRDLTLSLLRITGDHPQIFALFHQLDTLSRAIEREGSGRVHPLISI